MPNTEQSIQETGGIPEIELEMEVSGMTMTPVDKTLSVENMAADAKATGDAIADMNVELSGIMDDIEGIQEWTGEDIPINTDNEAPSIADAVADSISVGELKRVLENIVPEKDIAV